MKTWLRPLTVFAAALLALSVLTACDSDDPEPLRIGASADPALQAAAGVYASVLSRSGRRAVLVDRRDTEPALLDATAVGAVDLFPAFTGELLDLLSSSPVAYGGDELIAEVSRALPQGVSIGDPTQAGNRPQLLIAAALRDRYGVDDLAGCGALPAGLPLVTIDGVDDDVLGAFAACRPGPVTRLASAQEVLARVSGGEALGVLPALDTAAAEAAGPDAQNGPEVQALSADGAPRAQTLLPVYRSAALTRNQLKALSRVAGELSTADLAELAGKVRGGADPAAVGREWVGTHGV